MLASIPPDQLQFVSAQLGAFFFAFLYRHLLNIHRKSHSSSPSSSPGSSPTHSPRASRSSSPSLSSSSSSEKALGDSVGEQKDTDDEQLNVSTSRTNNLLALAVPGLLISYLCYGQLVIHIVILSLICYALLLTVSPRYVHLVTLAVAFIHLSYLHFDRLLYEFKVSAVDVTAAIMVLVQKVTCIALALHDGYRSKKLEHKLSPSQEREALDRVPSPLEYFAYIFNFQTVICGPMIFYSDFRDFLTGSRLKKAGLTEYPSVMSVAVKNILWIAAIATGMLVFAPLVPPSLLIDSSFAELSFLRKLLLCYFISMAVRLKYYFAWTLSETISNISGLGFSGIDKDGKAEWTLASNIDIVGFENSFSFRDALQVWNKNTSLWLRRTVYERVPAHNAVALTACLSALWHGLHPSYYLTFLTGSVLTSAGRSGRRTFRHRFIGNGKPVVLEYIYHGLTWIVTRISVIYMIIPFILLDFRNSLRFYHQMNYFGHVAGLFLIFLAPKVFKKN